MASTSTYIIRGGVAGRERLRVLSHVMGPMTLALLRRAGVAPGARCLDVGCGGGDVTLMLAALAGADGSAVGVDIDGVKLRLARDEAAAAGVHNVEYRRAALAELPADGTFDVGYARFLLTHLPDPAGALVHIAEAVRPGGVVAIQDIDYTGGFCHPRCAAFDYYWDLYPRLARHVGGDPTLGRLLPGLFAEAGLENIGVHIEQPAGFDADTKLLSALTLEAIAETAVAAGLAERDDVETAVRDFHEFAARADTMLTIPRMVQVWGQLPAAR